jgi:hypothetical protein
MQQIHLFYCPVHRMCSLILSSQALPRPDKLSPESKPVRVLHTALLVDAGLYKAKLDDLLGIDEAWFSDDKLVPTAWYLQLIIDGAKIEKYALTATAAEHIRWQLHLQALDVLSTARYKKYRGAALWGRTVNNPYITNILHTSHRK